MTLYASALQKEPKNGIKITMKKTRKISLIALLAFVLLAAGCTKRVLTTTSDENGPYAPGQNSPAQSVSMIFVESTNGTDDGMKRLISSMQYSGLDIYQTSASAQGLIASGDVVLLKINCQWAERGGTNTDLIRSVIQVILDHPGGFNGEIIVADNGQAQFGSDRRGGSLDWANANSADRRTSTLDVIRSFQAKGYHVTGVLWDEFTAVRVSEFSAGNMTD